MALVFNSDSGSLVIPSAPAQWTAAPASSGTSTTGVVILVGEADIGPGFAAESDVTTNFFGPRQFARVQAKYGSGHIVDAFKALTAPSLDAGVRGAPSAVYILKTNEGEKADGTLGSYGVLQAKTEGSLGNRIGYSVSEKVYQVLPSASAAYVLDASSETIKVAANGAAPYPLQVTPGYATPALAAVGILNYLLTGVNQSFLNDIMVSGGTSYQPCGGPVLSNISVVKSGLQVTISLATATWTVQPVAGQTLKIPAGSTISGAGAANEGFYIVLSSSLNTVIAKKVKDTAGGAPTLPVNVAPVGASGTDFQVYDPLTFTAAKGKFRTDQTGITTWAGAISGSTFVISLTTALETWGSTPHKEDLCKFLRGGNYYWFKVVSATSTTVTLTQLAPTPAVSAVGAFVSEVVGGSTIEFIDPNVAGIAQSLLFQRLATSTGIQFYGADGNASPISSTGAIYTSAAEQKVAVNVVRSSDNTNESWSAGGDVVLTIGKDDTVHQPISISSPGNVMTLGTYGTIDMTQYRTVGDLAVFINSIPNWHAVANPAFKQLSPRLVIDHILATAPSAEDEASAANQNLIGAMPCRIKKDAYDMITAVANSRVVEFPGGPDSPSSPVRGLPSPFEVTGIAFLSGGTKGGTGNADVQAALDAAGLIVGNFVVPLFSQDATADIAESETDSASTYDIATINAALSDHVSRFSQFKTRKPRQGFGSFRGSFLDAKHAAQVLANFRMASLNFLDVNVLGTNGLKFFQPWMLSAIEAGMQAAASYRPLFNKGINISGVRQNAADFNVNDDDAVEDALLNGLTVVRALDGGGGFGFVKDNTTYNVDNNTFYNSVQAVYGADTIAQTAGQRMNRAFVGQSFADVTPTIAASFFRGIMASLKKDKWIAGSSDAPSGYKNLVIEIQAPAMTVQAEVKEATGVYWVPINFLVSEIQGSATA